MTLSICDIILTIISAIAVVFNVLVIIGACAVFAPVANQQLAWKSVTRDMFWNTVAFTYLLGAFADQAITMCVTLTFQLFHSPSFSSVKNPLLAIYAFFSR